MFEQDFLGFINDNRLVDKAEKTLLAVSGGLDSTVMATLFHRTALPFAIAHVDFGLRGSESDDDARFVESMADRFGVPFHLTRVDTARIAADRGVSIQMVARELRYHWFGQIRAQHGYGCVATAHHQNDVLETMLLNLTRGTGLAGLHGIAVRKHQPDVGMLIRPLLFSDRARLLAYAEEHQLAYREDRSNASDYYARNRIRHHVVPVLTSLNPGLWATLSRTVDHLRAAEQLMQAELDRSWQELAQPMPDGSTRLPVDALLALSEGAFRLVSWLRPYGFTAEQCRQIWASLIREPGQQVASATHTVVHERGFIVLSLFKLTSLSNCISIEYENESRSIIDLGNARVTIDVTSRAATFVPDTDPAIAWLDADRLTRPLTMRYWQQGDRFRPLGMAGTKLVSNLLNELKLTQQERAETLVLLSGDTIAWVVGRRIAHSFRVRPDTQRLARLVLTLLG